MTDFTRYFAPGVKNTLFLKNGVNFYNRGPWTQIYNNTELDRWYVGDFAAANYIISVEYDSQKKETMTVLVVARPDEASYNIYGRASIDDPLITINATVNDSYLSLRLSPIIPEYEGVRVIYSAQYFATLTDLQRPAELTYLVEGDDFSGGGSGGGEIPGSGGGGSETPGSGSGSGDSGTVDNTNLSAIDRTLTPTIDGQFDLGISLRRFNNLFLKNFIDLNGVLISTNDSGGIELPEGSTLGGNDITSFSTISVSGSADVESNSAGDSLRLVAGSGIEISTDPETNSITFSSTGGGSSASTGAVSANAFGAIAVSGQSTVRADAPSDTLTFVAGTGIQITTNATSDRITITNTGTSTGSGSSSTAQEIVIQEVVEGVYPLALAEGTDTIQGQSLYATSGVTLDVLTGTLNAIASSAKWADLAENYQADAAYEPGTVLEFGGEKEVTAATLETKKIAGVVSTQPAYLMNDGLKGDMVIALALMGRVPCKVTGKINKGDLLVSAGNGLAKSSDDPKLGAVIGKSLENFEGDQGLIEIVVGRL